MREGEPSPCWLHLFKVQPYGFPLEVTDLPSLLGLFLALSMQHYLESQVLFLGVLYIR